MEKKLLEQGMEPRDTEAAGDTFFFEGLELAKDMTVCQSCGEIRGLFRLRGGGRFHSQTCGCPGRRQTPQAAEEVKSYLKLDFASAVTLCYCCGQVLMPNGSRWSRFYCDECRGMIVRLNICFGFSLIPMGRHSMMNKLFLTGKDAADPAAVFRFAEGWNSLVNRIEVVSDWKKIIVARNIRKAGLARDREAGLFAYLERMRPDFWSQFSAFYGLRKHVLSRCRAPQEAASAPRPEATGDAGLALQEPDYSTYMPQEEIRCVFYVLVVRNQALEKKWPGGPKDYRRKYGRPYNDKITVNCAMSFDFNTQLIDMADSGLDMGEDFTIFDAVSERTVEDGEPCPTNADWLGGYYQDGGVMIFMKQ